MHDVATKPDLEAIMRRLKGKNEPSRIPKEPAIEHSSSDENELKQIVKMLGTKLKEALEEKQILHSLLTHKETELASIQQLCAEKEQTISSLQTANETLVNPNTLKNLHTSWASDQEKLKIAEEKLSHLRKIQDELNTERNQLLEELRKERLAKQTTPHEASAQVLRMAMTCRQLEDEIHSLTCEKVATLRQYREVKTLCEQLQASEKQNAHELAAHKTALAEKDKKLASIQNDYINLSASHRNLLEEAEHTTAELENRQYHIDKLQSIENELNSKILELMQQTSFLQHALQNTEQELQSVRKNCSDIQQSLAITTDEKNKALHRIQEVEEVLVLKLTHISEFQEQIAALHNETASLQQNNGALTHALQETREALQQLESEHSSLLDVHATLKQQLQQIEKNNASLIERSERLECLLNMVREAREQAVGLLNILDGEKAPVVSVAKLVEQLSLRSEDVSGILVEDRFEQHDLF